MGSLVSWYVYLNWDLNTSNPRIGRRSWRLKPFRSQARVMSRWWPSPNHPEPWWHLYVSRNPHSSFLIKIHKIRINYLWRGPWMPAPSCQHSIFLINQRLRRILRQARSTWVLVIRVFQVVYDKCHPRWCRILNLQQKWHWRNSCHEYYFNDLKNEHYRGIR